MGVVVILLSIFAGFIIGRVITNKEIQKINTHNKERLQKEEEEIQKQIERSSYQLQVLRREAESKGQEYLAKEKEIAQIKLENFQEKINTQITKTEEDYGKKLEEISCQMQSFKEKNEQVKQNIEKEIKDLELKRASVIEAQKREEEIKNKSLFYQLQLKEEDKEDIELIWSIQKKLNTKCLNKLIWSQFYLPKYGEMVGRVLPQKLKVSGIYKITNIQSGKCYIGQSVDIKTRWSNHIKSSLGIDGIAHNKIHDAIAEEGIWNFTFELLEECPKEKLNEREKYYIGLYKADSWGYNSTKGGS